LENLSEYGEKIGISFQLIDDLIGIHGDTQITGKFVGNDIREGKKTLPILLAFESLDTKGREELTSVFGNPNATNSEIELVVEKISKSSIDEEVRNIANTFTQLAFDKLSIYDNSRAKNSLERSARFIVERSL
jgi:geranylgeranyl diphosphate synthase type I